MSDTESFRHSRHTECPEGFGEVFAQLLECDEESQDPGMIAEDDSQAQGVLDNAGDQEKTESTDPS